MLKGIPLPSSDFVASDALAILSAVPVSVSRDGQLAVIDVLYTNGSSQLHAFVLVDLTDGSYITNYNTVVGLGDETSIEAYSASVSWSDDTTPTVNLSYEDLTDPSSSGLYNRIASVTGTSLNSSDLVERASNVLADGSIQRLITDDTGRYVAFETAATNLAPTGNLDTNTITDVYLLDTETETLTRISALADGTEADEECELQDITIVDGKISVLFSTTASETFSALDTNTDADLYLWQDGEIRLVTSNAEQNAGGYDGGLAAFAGNEIAFVATDLLASDTDGLLDLYLVDTVALTKRIDSTVNALTFAADYDLWIEGNNNTEVILGLSGVSQASTDLSNQLLGIDTTANTSEIYTLNSGGTLADDVSDTPAISDFGNTVAYRTSATNLANQDSLAFVVNHDNILPQGTLSLVGSVRVGQTVAADLSSFNDIDGYGSGFTYYWSLDGVLQTSVTANSFTLTEAMLGQTLNLMIEYVDNWGVSESVTLASATEVGNRGIELKLGGKTLNHGTISAELDGTTQQISSDSPYFDLQGTNLGTVSLDPAMHTSDIGIGDVIASLRHIVGLSQLSGRAALAADVDNDSTIGIGDVIAQLRHIVGLSPINRFDVVDLDGSVVGDNIQNLASIELILNGDVDLSTELTPTFYDL